MIRVGQGYDAHQLVPNRKLILGGVLIDFHLGLKGHSDADGFNSRYHGCNSWGKWSGRYWPALS